MKKLNRVRFLCVTREHDHSVDETNLEIERLLHYTIKYPEKFNSQSGFYHNQPIIITKNDNDLGLSNGDLGIIRKDSVGADNLKIWFEDGKALKLQGNRPLHIDCVTIKRANVRYVYIGSFLLLTMSLY